MYQSGNLNNIERAESALLQAEKNLRRAKLRREFEMKPRKRKQRVGIILTLAAVAVSVTAGSLVHPGLLFAGIVTPTTVWFAIWIGRDFKNEVRPTAKEILNLEFWAEDAKEELAKAYMETN